MGKQGPCHHCGVTSTPLWRNGPPEKPVLCNACGSRWRTKGTLANYTPLHARADPDEFEYRVQKVRTISIKNKAAKVLKRKQNPDIEVVGGVAPGHGFQKGGGDTSDYNQVYWKDFDEDTSNRSSSGSAISNSESCVQLGSAGESDLTGPAQSIVWDTTVPSRKRTCVSRKFSLTSTFPTSDPVTMTKQQANWSPYDNNGGTVAAIAGTDYCVIASDTRMSTGYSILTRDYSKICKLADKSVMASSGFQADVRALQKVLAARHLSYQHQHNKQMSCPAMAQLLSNTLYYKRFFPYYAFNVLGGLDNEGKGCVYTYDAVGSYERVGYSAQGSGATLITPFLDNQLKSPSPLLLPAQDAVTPLSEIEAIDLVKTCFASATERDIYTGDGLEVVILNADGIRREYMELRKD